MDDCVGLVQHQLQLQPYSIDGASVIYDEDQ